MSKYDNSCAFFVFIWKQKYVTKDTIENVALSAMRAIATFVAIKANPKFTTQIDANNAAKIIPKTNKQYFAIVRFAKIIKGSFLRKGSIS